MKALFFLSILFTVSIVKAQTEKIPAANQINNIDSLKWKFYSLNCDVLLKKRVRVGLHYETIADSIFSPLECDAKITDIETAGDSIIYYFDFFRLNDSDLYLQKVSDPYVGVGYVKKRDIYYPILGKAAYDEDLSFYKFFFDRADKKFRDFLLNYKGTMTPWLKEQATKRNIIPE